MVHRTARWFVGRGRGTVFNSRCIKLFNGDALVHKIPLYRKLLMDPKERSLFDALELGVLARIAGSSH